MRGVLKVIKQDLGDISRFSLLRRTLFCLQIETVHRSKFIYNGTLPHPSIVFCKQKFPSCPALDYTNRMEAQPLRIDEAEDVVEEEVELEMVMHKEGEALQVVI